MLLELGKLLAARGSRSILAWIPSPSFCSAVFSTCFIISVFGQTLTPSTMKLLNQWSCFSMSSFLPAPVFLVLVTPPKFVWPIHTRTVLKLINENISRFRAWNWQYRLVPNSKLSLFKSLIQRDKKNSEFCWKFSYHNYIKFKL